MPPGARVDATGTRRRLQALAVPGRSARVLAGLLQMHPERVGRILRGCDLVTLGTKRRVRELYDQIWDVPVSALTLGERLSVSKARAHAARCGWAPPQAWDDDDDEGHWIDDPAADPASWEPQPTTWQPLSARLEDLADVMADGLTPQQAAWRLGVSPAYVRGLLRRQRSRRMLTAS